MFDYFSFNNILLVLVAFVFIISRKYRHLISIPVYAFATLILSYLYRAHFYNWYFYQFYNYVAAALFIAILFEILHKDLKKFKGWMLSVYVAFIIILILPISMLTKISLPYTIANIIFILGLYYGYKAKHPILLIFGTISAIAFVVDVMELIVTENTVLGLLRYVEQYTFTVTMTLLLLTALIPMIWPALVKAGHNFFDRQHKKLNG